MLNTFWFYLQPLSGTDPMLVLEFSMLVLESFPTQTIELFLSGNIPADLVNSYLKQHAPNMQGRYLELMLAMNENRISGKLQNEMVKTLFVCYQNNSVQLSFEATESLIVAICVGDSATNITSNDYCRYKSISLKYLNGIHN